ncbi:MAG: O-acetylhomoserine aminocarboxypropyltransferase/cysteine synthase family protein [Butyricicoccaceae bacterium]
MKRGTKLLHGAFSGDQATGATQIPVYLSSAFGHGSAEELENIFHNKAQGFSYTRIGNPTVASFEARMTELEGGIGTVAFASGMAAISSLLLSVLSAGDEIISSAGVFGGTLGLFADLKQFGITTRFVDAFSEQALDANINEHTRLIFAETIGNPKLDVTDVPKLAEMAHARGLLLVMDNTTVTPYLAQVLALGADVVVNSTSKYINGSSTAISGTVTDSGRADWSRFPAMQDWKKFGPYALTARLRKKSLMDMGACLSPMNAFLNSVGMETLALRMERQCDNALKLARTLEQLDGVAGVNYPGLTDSPWHETAKEILDGYGAILTFRLGTRERAFAVIDGLKYAINITNIGDVRTLVVHPESTIYAAVPPEELSRAGVTPDMIRVSVGIEDIEDLIEDFTQAIQSAIHLYPL